MRSIIPAFQNAILRGRTSETRYWQLPQPGEGEREKSEAGDQALWLKKTADGGFGTVTISPINAPTGHVKSVLTKGNPKK